MPVRQLTKAQIEAENNVILSRMAQGEFSALIALDLGISRQAVSKRLLRSGKACYLKAMRQGAKVRLLRTVKQIQAGVDITRKRLSLDVLYCERHAPKVLTGRFSTPIRKAFFRVLARDSAERKSVPREI